MIKLQLTKYKKGSINFGAELAFGIIHIKLEVGDIQKTRVLMDVYHVRIESCQV